MSKSITKAIIKPLGDSALIVELGVGIHPSIQQKVSRLSELLYEQPFEGFIETVAAYTNLTIHYSPYVVHHSQPNQKEPRTPFEKVSAYMDRLVQQIGEKNCQDNNLVTIPVVYGGEFGPDLDYVANYHGISAEEVIRIHSKNDYLVYMIGFAPGFPFLGGMSEDIATPRKETPRLAVAPGSVGIAGKQTGMYSLETPGGWQIIGRTPLDLFLPHVSPPTLLQAGDTIRFLPITPNEYATYKGMKK